MGLNLVATRKSSSMFNGESALLQPSLSPVVSKAPSLTPCQRRRVPNASEHALYELLKKRHEKYMQKLSHHAVKLEDKKSAVPVHWDLPDKGEHSVHNINAHK